MQLASGISISLKEPFQRIPPNFLNIVSLPVLREVSRDPWFRRVPFASHTGVVIFEPVEPSGR
jgi:hypothetical protein